jgi:hypothetical protein
MEEEDGLGRQVVYTHYRRRLCLGQGYLADGKMLLEDEIEQMELLLLANLVVFAVLLTGKG